MSITLSEEIGRASRALCALERFARRREHFLDGLDWNAFDEQFIRETSMADDRLNDELAETWIYLAHLEDRLSCGGAPHVRDRDGSAEPGRRPCSARR